MNREKAMKAIKDFLQEFGYPCEGDMEKTPERVLKMYEAELLQSKPELTCFKSSRNQMITKPRIFFKSRCAHHCEPFIGFCYLAYIPNGKEIGLSKISRLVRYHAGNLQTQEEMAENIARHFMQEVEPKGVVVQIRAKHLCECRPGINEVVTSPMINTQIEGIFKTDTAAKMEALESFDKEVNF